MSEKEILAFRMILAEEGTEMTPEQAEKAYKASRSLVNASKKMSMIDIWNIQESEMDGMSEEEKEELVDLYRCAKDL